MELRRRIEKVQKVNKEIKSITPIEVGDKVVYRNYGLIFSKGTDKEHHFKVNYELLVKEVSKSSLKVTCIDFTTHDSKVNNDKNNRPGIINFINNKWVDKKDVELLVDQSHKRNLKLRELGI